MSRLSLDVSALQVETFAVGPVPAAPLPARTYPDCVTATGCTCYIACQSVLLRCEPATYPDCPTATGCTCYDLCRSVVMPVCAA